MNQDVKKAWVEALRSDKWKQGREELCPTHDTRCCLGVLTELFFQAHPDLQGRFDSNGWPRTIHGHMNGKTFLPSSVCLWAGLKDANPWVETEGVNYWLGELNDDGTPFPEIADIIETAL